MRASMQLQIPDACHEDWHQMSAAGKGRFCAACNKQVIDFTTWSDAAIARYFEKEKGKVCGRFSNEQLGRSLYVQPFSAAWLRYTLSLAIPAVFFTARSAAQGTVRVESVQLPASPSATGSGSLQHPATVSGIVYDEKGNPVPYASVMIKGKTMGASADAHGAFSISSVELPVVLVASSVGFNTQEMPIDAAKGPVAFQLSASEPVVYTVGMAVTVRSVRKKRNLFKRDKTKEVCSTPVAPSMLVYPNPATVNTYMHIKPSHLPAGKYTLEVSNAAGQLIYTNAVTVPVADAPIAVGSCFPLPGNYFIRLIPAHNGKPLVQQVVVSQ